MPERHWWYHSLHLIFELCKTSIDSVVSVQGKSEKAADSNPFQSPDYIRECQRFWTRGKGSTSPSSKHSSRCFRIWRWLNVDQCCHTCPEAMAKRPQSSSPSCCWTPMCWITSCLSWYRASSASCFCRILDPTDMLDILSNTSTVAGGQLMFETHSM